MAEAKHSGVSADSQVMNRRNLLAVPFGAALVAAAGAYAAGAEAVEAATETPVMTLFKEWKRIEAAFDDPSVSDEQMDRLLVDRGAVNVKMNSTASQTPLDVLMKIMVASEYGEYGRYDTVFDTGWDEAHALVGEVA